MPPIAGAFIAFIAFALLLSAAVLAIAYRSHQTAAAAGAQPPEQSAPRRIHPSFYLVALAGIALAVLSGIANRAALLENFAPETPNREYWANADALIATLPYLALLLPVFLGRKQPAILALAVLIMAGMAAPYMREWISSQPILFGPDHNYEATVITRIARHSALVLLFAFGVAAWALAQPARSADRPANLA